MTVSFEPTRRYTVEEYLELEASAPEAKYEYRDGVVVNMRRALAMAGGAPDHALVTANTIRALGNRLTGGPCRVYSNDLRVRIPRKTLYTYPDAVVVCDKPQFDTHNSAGATLTNPLVIVEVLSPSTERYDRGDKFALYREIPSLAEYILISQSQPRVETYFRHDDGGWTFRPFAGLDAVIKLMSVNVEIPLADLYAGVEFPPESPLEDR